MAAPPLVRTARHDGVLDVCLARPDKKNALTTAMYQGLVDALAELEADDGLRAARLGAEGADYCAGNDLFDFAAPSVDEAPVTRFLRGLAVATKPLVAGMRGRAVGVGATMLLHCDLVYLAPGAELRFPFVDLGLVPEAGSTLLLPALIGRSRAAEVLLLGRPVEAEAAVTMGLATAVVDDPDAAAAEAAAALAAKPADALRSTRALLSAGRDAVVARQQAEAGEFARLLAGPEFRAALERFGRPRTG